MKPEYITASEIRDRQANPMKYMSEYQKMWWLQSEYRHKKTIRKILAPLLKKMKEILSEQNKSNKIL